MIRRIANVRYLALVLLALAHLSVTLHAAEHGIGPHNHDGAPCLYGAIDGDDPDGLPLARTTLPPHSETGVLDAPRTESFPPRSDVRIPPATGPPASP